MQTCAVIVDTVTVILAVVIPVCVGTVFFLLAAGALLVWLNRRRLQKLKRRKNANNIHKVPENMQNSGQNENQDLEAAINTPLERPHQHFYKDSAAAEYDFYDSFRMVLK